MSEPITNPYRHMDDEWDHASEAAIFDEGVSAAVALLREHQARYMEGEFWHTAYDGAAGLIEGRK